MEGTHLHMTKSKIFYQRSLFKALGNVEACVKDLEERYDIMPDPSIIDLFNEDDFFGDEKGAIDDVEFNYALTKIIFFLINRLKEVNDTK